MCRRSGLLVLFLAVTIASVSQTTRGDQTTTFSISALSQQGATISGTFGYDFNLGEITSADIVLSDSVFGSECPCLLTDVVNGSIDSLTLIPDPSVMLSFTSISPTGFTLCVLSNEASCGFNVSNIGVAGGALFDPFVSGSGSVTPEPSSLLLLGTGFLGLLAVASLAPLLRCFAH